MGIQGRKTLLERRYKHLVEIVHAKVTAYNLDLEKEDRLPLPTNEITHLSRSIAKWIWTRFTPQTFSMIQTRRGRKGAHKGGLARAQQRTNALIEKGINAGAKKA